jgi:hypothetical protein
MKKFEESLNAYVFTTKYVLKEGHPIVYVSHDDDGDWQFLGKADNLKEEDAMVISLGEMIEYDSTILEIADLPKGHEATRKDRSSQWRIQ